MGILQRVTVPTLILIWAFVYMFGLRDNKPDDLLLIKPVFYLLFLLYIINTTGDIREWRQEKGKNIDTKAPKNIYIFIGLVVAYLLLISYLGFIITSILFILANLILFQVKNKYMFIFFPLIITFLLYIVFKILFNIPLPAGFLGF